MIDTLLRDLRSARRQLTRAPLITATAIITLALGIGANTAIFSLLDAIVLRPLPVDEPNGLVLLGSRRPDGPHAVFSHPAYVHLQSNGTATADLFAHAGLGTTDVSIDGLPEPGIRDVVMVSGNYFSALRVGMVVGRSIGPSDDDRPAGAGGGGSAGAGGGAVAVISHRLWQSRFGGDRSAIGRSMTLNGTAFTIIGVAPATFFGTSVGDMVDLWIPLAAAPAVRPASPDRPSLLTDMNASWLTVMGRLKPGATSQQAQRDLEIAFARFQQDTFGGSGGARADLVNERLEVRDGRRGVSWIREERGAALIVLIVMVGTVLLIACANVANLFIGRVVSRQREMAIRQALGASRLDLLRQLLTESLLVAAAGGALGLIVARWSWAGLLSTLSPGRGFAPVDVQIDLRVLAFTAAISMVTAMLCGLAPAWQAGASNLLALARGSQRSGGLAAKTLLVAQVGLAALLLVAAGQLVRSFRHLAQTPTGFAAAHRIVLQVDATRAYRAVASGVGSVSGGSASSATGSGNSSSAGGTSDRRDDTGSGGTSGDSSSGSNRGGVEMFEQLRERLASVPGVRSAALSDSGLFSGSQTRVDVSTAAATACSAAVWMHVAPGYFSTLDLQMRSGREFAAHDAAGGPLVAIVNDTLARRCFGDRQPLGSIVTIGKNLRLQVIGVVGDTRYRDLRADAPAIVFAPFAQSAMASMPLPTRGMFTLRADVPLTAALAADLTREIHTIAPSVIVSDVTAMTDLIDRTLAEDRLVAMLSAAFGVLAIVLAACGLYSVMSTAVARRTPEIGIRGALGAQPAWLARAVFSEALGTVAIGIALGLAAAALTANFIAHFIAGVHPRDPLTFATVALTILAIGGIAAFFPARRAAAIDPLIAIREASNE
jgi:hypothetical protein